MSRPSFGRTHVVDLGSMTREQLIDVAKKQATQIREKNIAIRSMEELIESFTGDRQATARSGEGDVTSLPRASSRDWAGGDSPVAVAPPSNEASALTEELRALEARYYEAQGALAESTAAYDALAKKVASWKETVMQTSQRDEQRIAQLEQQLAQTRHACAPASTQDAKLADLTAADVPAAVLDAAVQEKLSAWKERTKAALQAERDRVVELEQEVGALRAAAADAESRAGASADADATLAAVRAELEASQAEVARAGAAAEAAQVESERAAAELVTARADADTARAELETAHSELESVRGAVSKRCSHENTVADALRALHAHVGSLQEETGRLHHENAVLRNRVNDLLAFREAVQREVSNGLRQRESAGFVADRTV